MDAARTVAAHPAVPDLRQVLAELRRPPYRLRIGLDREIRCAALLERLAERGVTVASPAEAAGWLAPLISSNAADQRAVRTVLERATPSPASPDEEALSRPTQTLPIAAESNVPALRPANVRSWLAAGVILAAVAIASVLLSGGGTGPGPGTPPPAKGNSDAVPFQLAVGVLTAMSVWMLVMFGRHRREQRLLPDSTGLRERLIANDAGPLELFAPGPLRTVLRALREHTRTPGAWADISASIRATLRAGGLPDIVFGGRPRLPDYLMLAEMRGADDQAAMMARLLLSRLQSARLHLDAYAFAVDPVVLRHWTRPHALNITEGTTTLHAVAAQMTGRRLLMLSDGRPLLDPLTGRLALHLTLLRQFEPRVLLTPVPRAAWGARERALAQEGFAILPLSPKGLGAMALWLTAPEEHPAPPLPEAGDVSDIAALIDRDPAFTRAEPPPAAELRRSLSALRRALGPAGFRLLAAVAVSPLPGAGLTIRLARRFAAEGYAVDEETMARLTRLPWLRRAEMPDWLRANLLTELRPAERLAAVDTLLLLLAGADDTPRALDRAGRGRLTRLVWRHQAELVRDDPVLTGLLAEAGVTPGPDARHWLVGALALTAGVVIGAQGAALPMLLDRQAVWSSPTTVPAYGIVLALFAAGNIGSTIYGAWARHGRIEPIQDRGRRGPALRKLTAVLFGPPLTVITAALVLMSVLASGGVMAPGWQGALFTAGLGALLIDMSSHAARLGTVRRAWGAPWLSDWQYPWGALFAITLGGYSVFTMLMVAMRADSVGQWVQNELPMVALVLVAGLAAARGMAATVPPSEVAAWFLLFAGGQTLAWVACWSVMALLGFNVGLDFGLLTGLPHMWVAATTRLMGGLTIALVLSRRGRWAGPVGAAFFVMAGITCLALPFDLTSLQALSLLPLPALVLGWMLGLRRRKLALCIGLAMVPGLLLAALSWTFVRGEPFWLSAVASVVGWVMLRPLLRWVLVRPRVEWLLWGRSLALLPCVVSVLPQTTVGWPGAPWLALPVAAWLAARHGRAALGPVGIVLAPMLVRLDTPIITLTGSWGTWLAALLLVRLVAEPSLRSAIAAERVLPRTLAWAMALGSAVWWSVPGTALAGVSVALLSLLPLLLTLVGLSRVAWQPVLTPIAWVTVPSLLIHMGWADLHVGVVSLGAAIGSTAVLLGGVVVVMMARSARGWGEADGVGKPQPLRDGLRPNLPLLALGWFDATVLSIRAGQGADVSLLGFAHLAALAFWFGFAAAPRWTVFVALAVAGSALNLVGLSAQFGFAGLSFGSFQPVRVAVLALQLWAFCRLGAAVRTSGWDPAAQGRPPRADGVGGADQVRAIVVHDLRRAAGLALWLALLAALALVGL